jgi:hypothetical protein
LEPLDKKGDVAVSEKHYLPPRIGAYLKRLQMEYMAAGDSTKHTIVSAARVLVVPETDYDNWNGGTYGHDVFLYVPFEVFSLFRLAQQAGLEENIRQDLNACTGGVENEYFHKVHLEPNDEESPDYQRAISITSRPAIDPDKLSIWKPGLIRLFICHKDEHKRQATILANSLEPFGISSFVAHETIEPTKEWRKEIMNGLETMEIMLAFLTDKFNESPWTNQEVGFALGKGIPVVSLKMAGGDPPGFISHEQALRGQLDSPEASAQKVQKLLAEKLGREERIQAAFIRAFIDSPNWSETTERFDRMSAAIEKLTDDNLAEIIRGYAKNNQLYDAAYLNNKYDRMAKFLERTTGREFVIKGRNIIEKKAIRAASVPDDDIPF